MTNILNAENLANHFPKSDFGAGLQKRIPVTTNGVALGLHAIEAEAPREVRQLNTAESQPATSPLQQLAETALQQEPSAVQSSSPAVASIYPSYPAEPVTQEPTYDQAAHEQASRYRVLESLGATASPLSDASDSPVIDKFSYIRDHPRPYGEQADQLDQQFGTMGYTTDMKQSDLELAA